MNKHDKDLLKRAQNGDMDAFVELFEPLRLLMRTIAMRIVGTDDADDVTMDTFLKAWKALPRFRGRSSLRTWLCRIARNCALDLARKRSRYGDLASNKEQDPDWGNVSDLDTHDPSAGMRKEETVTLVRGALEKLPSEQRKVLLLRYADELSYSEIAAALGISIGTVMSRIYYGKRKMYSLIKEVY